MFYLRTNHVCVLQHVRSWEPEQLAVFSTTYTDGLWQSGVPAFQPS